MTGDGAEGAIAEPPTVVLIGKGWSGPGGLNRYVRGLHTALRGIGYDVSGVVFDVASDSERGLLGAGPETAPLPVRLLRQARAVRSAAADADLVDVHMALYGVVPLLSSVAGRLPLLVHFHGPWAAESEVESGGLVRVRWLVEWLVYRRARRLITLSSAFKRVLVERYHVSPWQVHVVAPGVDLDRFTPGRAQARRDLGLDDGTVLVFCARRLARRMGIDVLLEAWALLPRDSTDGRPRRLVIAGSGREQGRLEALIVAHGLGDSVAMVGTISDDDLVRHYQSADLCVVPSRSLEGFGLVVIEALACGAPVIVTDVGGLPEAIHGLDPSLIVAPDRADLLAARIASALDRHHVPSPVACRAFAERFSWSAAVDAHRRLYAATMDPEAAPAEIRVVYLDHCARISGAEISMTRLLPFLEGVDTHVVLGEEGPLVGRLGRVGVSVEVLPMADQARDLRREAFDAPRLPLRTVLSSLAYTLRLARRLRRLQPDVIHTNSLKAGLYGSCAGRLAGVPVVWHARDRIAEDYLPGPAVRLTQVVARWLPAAVIANSAQTLTTLPPGRRRGRLDRVIYNAYRPERPTEPPSAPSDRPLRIGMVGRLAPWKGQHIAIEAFARAFPDTKQRLLLAGGALFGENDYEVRLRSDIARLGVEDRVELLGAVEDIEGLLAGIDVLVHASTSPEPFGQVIVEGMAAGLAVVATAAGGPTEIITSGTDGLLVPPGDIEALRAALTALADDPELRLKLGHAAQVRAEDYAPEAIARSVTAVYEEILRRPARRGPDTRRKALRRCH